MKQNFFLQILLASSLFTFSGCSLVSEATRQSIEDTKIVQSGSTIQGEGFSIRVPEANLYLVRNSPGSGDLSLRTTERDWPGGSYNVYPFTLPAPASSLQAAWQAHIAQHTTRKFLNDYRILSQYTNVWQDSVAWFHTGYIPSGVVAANCVMRHGTNYYWIIRSIGILSDKPEDTDSSRVEQDLQTFLDGFQFNVQ